jgi:hypothetical protein
MKYLWKAVQRAVLKDKVLRQEQDDFETENNEKNYNLEIYQGFKFLNLLKRPNEIIALVYNSKLATHL